LLSRQGVTAVKFFLKLTARTSQARRRAAQHSAEQANQAHRKRDPTRTICALE
jgi:hypothetical protein